CLGEYARWEVEFCSPPGSVDLYRGDKLDRPFDPDRRKGVDDLCRGHGPLVLHAHVATNNRFVRLAPCHAEQGEHADNPGADRPCGECERASDHAHAHRHSHHRGHGGAALDPLVVPGGQHQVALSVAAAVFDHAVTKADL